MVVQCFRTAVFCPNGFLGALCHWLFDPLLSFKSYWGCLKKHQFPANDACKTAALSHNATSKCFLTFTDHYSSVLCFGMGLQWLMQVKRVSPSSPKYFVPSEKIGGGPCCLVWFPVVWYGSFTVLFQPPFLTVSQNHSYKLSKDKVFSNS